MRTLLGSAQTLGARRRALLLDPMPSRSSPLDPSRRSRRPPRRADRPRPLGQPRQQTAHVRTHGRLGIRHRSDDLEHV